MQVLARLSLPLSLSMVFEPGQLENIEQIGTHCYSDHMVPFLLRFLSRWIALVYICDFVCLLHFFSSMIPK